MITQTLNHIYINKQIFFFRYWWAETRRPMQYFLSLNCCTKRLFWGLIKREVCLRYKTNKVYLLLLLFINEMARNVFISVYRSNNTLLLWAQYQLGGRLLIELSVIFGMEITAIFSVSNDRAAETWYNLPLKQNLLLKWLKENWMAPKKFKINSYA